MDRWIKLDQDRTRLETTCDNLMQESREKCDPRTVNEIRRTARDLDTIFALSDEDQNGYLTARELNKCLDTKVLTANEVDLISSIKRAHAELSKLHNDGSRGISRDHLLAYLKTFYESRTTSFLARVDANRDGRWSNAEMDRAIADPSLTTEHRSFLKHMKSVSMCKGTINGLSESFFDCDELARTGRVQVSGHNLICQFRKYNQRANTPGREARLYAAGHDQLDTIEPEDCLQLPIAGGNCQFVSALSSLARTNKQAIKNMITDNNNNTYTVVFPGHPDHPITVIAPTPEEVDNHYVERLGSWAFVMQKAFGRLVNSDHYDDLEGGRIGLQRTYALRALTPGNVCEEFSTFDTEFQVLTSKLGTALSSGLPVQASIGGPAEERARTKNLKLHKCHAYAVLEIEPNAGAPGETLITLRDPIGNLAGTEHIENTGDGKFRLALKEFCTEFDSVQLGCKQPPRQTIYEWTNYIGQRKPFLESAGVLLGSGVAMVGAGTLRRTGALGLGTWAASETVNDAIAAYAAPNSTEALKYSLGAIADGAMTAGFASRLVQRTGRYGLGVAAAAFTLRWAIQKLL